MTNTGAASTADGFHSPFIGHLPGYLEESRRTGVGRPDEMIYNRMLTTQWRRLIDDPASRDESLIHKFLERHPSLLPGSHSMDGDSGHGPFPRAVISKPKLPGLSDREPDFMWIATDSESVYPILIEIETPHKQWFYGERAEINHELTHAQGQLAEWRAWFSRGHNRQAFLQHYEVPPLLARRRLEPRYVLIYGRRSNYEGSTRRLEKRAELARSGERLMSFDRLTPAKNSVLWSCVRRRQDGYEVVAVPPCLTLITHDDEYQTATGWHQALDNCPDMAPERRQFLAEHFDLFMEDALRRVSKPRDWHFRTVEWV